MADNPLLHFSTLPNEVPPFDQIKEEHFLPALENAIARARENIEKFKANQAAPDFENTVVALETSSELLDTVTSVFYNQLSAAGTDGLHALADKIGPISSAFSSDIILDETLFARVKAVYDSRETLDLTAEQSTLLEETYQGFARGGALLDEAGKKRLRDINERLSVLGPTFMNNVNKSAEAFEMVIEDKADLAGLPESAIDGAVQAASDRGYEGKWVFTLDYPSFGPFIRYADNRALREKIWRAFDNRACEGDFDNSPVILEIVALRDERAKLLGYETHAHYVLERRMAQTPEQVLAFLGKLKTTYKPAAQNDLADIKEFMHRQGVKDEIRPWDISYYAEKLKQKLFSFSSEDLRPYFPLHTVLKGTFEHFTRLFNLRFEENKSYPVWHQDVVAYDVFDNGSDDFIGTFYADFFPRKGKKQGAWKTSYRNQGLFNGKIGRPVVAIVCNFTKPTKTKPSLLTHDEVRTLFHEMGHAVHALVSDVTYSSLAGTNVKWDFVELPSQIQENWIYQEETLDMISGHYETGEKVPEELINKLNDARNFMIGWAGLRQINLGYLDIAWHTASPEDIANVGQFEDQATADTSLFPRIGGPLSNAFSHLFAGGYSAGYYSYKWAEVLDADAFEAFLEKGLYDRETAEAYKTHILSKGGSQHPQVLYLNFRGHEADPEALLRREGLLITDDQAA